MLYFFGGYFDSRRNPGFAMVYHFADAAKQLTLFGVQSKIPRPPWRRQDEFVAEAENGLKVPSGAVTNTGNPWPLAVTSHHDPILGKFYSDRALKKRALEMADFVGVTIPKEPEFRLEKYHNLPGII